jgi:hypothetical protein
VNPIREGRRSIGISSRAAVCAGSPTAKAGGEALLGTT